MNRSSNIKVRISSLILLSAATVWLGACSKPQSATVEAVSELTVKNLGCVFGETHLLNQMALPLLEGESLPGVTDLLEGLRKTVEKEQAEGRLNASDQQIEEFLMSYEELYRFVSEDLPKAQLVKTPDEHLKLMMEVEMGDQSSELMSELQQTWQRLRVNLSQSLHGLDARCEEPLPIAEQRGEEPEIKEEAQPLLEYWRQRLPAAVYGAHKTFATSYQSCGVVDRAPMVAADPSVQGIKVIGRHPAGGNIREISSIPLVVSTHQYIKNETPPKTGETCFNLKQNPLIYDFGGKPAASNAISSPLDLFRNAGTGGTHLGIDCSGYVFTAYAVAGLKMRHDRALTASQVFGINARMMKVPQSNGLGCLAQQTVDLEPGDLIASTGHVVLVDEVGVDPFGVGQITNRNSCTRANMNPSRYNFVISHAAPVKGAIGINRMQASTYFVGSSTMANGLRDYAVTACLDRFGEQKKAPTDNIAVVRHRGTPECKTEPLQLARQDCLSHCPLR